MVAVLQEGRAPEWKERGENEPIVGRGADAEKPESQKEKIHPGGPGGLCCLSQSGLVTAT